MVVNANQHRYVDVFELARTGASIEGDVPFAQMERMLPSLAKADGALQYVLSGFTDDRGRAAARLAFSGQVEQTCDRCGMAVSLGLEGEAHYYFVRTEQDLARIPVDESLEEPLLGSTRFDLFELLEDEAILALPISPRHDCCSEPAMPALEDVAGDGGQPHPFAALAQLKSRRQ